MHVLIALVRIVFKSTMCIFMRSGKNTINAICLRGRLLDTRCLRRCLICLSSSSDSDVVPLWIESDVIEGQVAEGSEMYMYSGPDESRNDVQDDGPQSIP